MQINVEYRTVAISLWTLHIGMVAFYDGGSVWGGQDPYKPSEPLVFRYHQGIGMGLRFIFPQFSRSLLRLDFGVPLSVKASPISSRFSLSYEQVF